MERGLGLEGGGGRGGGWGRVLWVSGVEGGKGGEGWGGVYVRGNVCEWEGFEREKDGV